MDLNNATGARGEAGDCRRQQRLREDQRVGEAERGGAEGTHNVVRDPVAQAGLEAGLSRPLSMAGDTVSYPMDGAGGKALICGHQV